MKHCNTCNTDKPLTDFFKRLDKWQHKCKSCEKEYKIKNNERQVELKQKHYLKHKDKIKNRVKEYNKINRNAMRKALYKNRPEQKIVHNQRVRLNELLKSKKQNSTTKLLGCTAIELKTHIEKQFEKGMTWDNYGLYGWHLDHIIPCAMFNLFDENDLKQCFHYTNLQPLWAKDNLLKSDKILKPTQTNLPL